MSYSIYAIAKDDYFPKAEVKEKNKNLAIARAKEFVKKYPDYNVFISHFRKEDGQEYYINPNGDAELTGKSWSSK